MRMKKTSMNKQWAREAGDIREDLTSKCGWPQLTVAETFTAHEPRLRSAWSAADSRDQQVLLTVLTFSLSMLISSLNAFAGRAGWARSDSSLGEMLPGILISASIAVLIVVIHAAIVSPSLREAAVLDEFTKIMAETSRTPSASPGRVGRSPRRGRRRRPQVSAS